MFVNFLMIPPECLDDRNPTKKYIYIKICSFYRCPVCTFTKENSDFFPVSWFSIPQWWYNQYPDNIGPLCVLLRWGVLSCEWSCDSSQFQDLGKQKSTYHVWFGERQCRTERVVHGRVIRFFFSEPTHDLGLVHGYAGTVYSSPVTMWNSCTIRWWIASLQPCDEEAPLSHNVWRMGYEGSISCLAS